MLSNVRRVKSVALILGLFACLAAATVADAKRSPRLEKLALKASDTEAANAALLRRSDFPAGWKVERGSGSSDAPPCGWNLSRFTLTGQAGATFSKGDAAVYSEVNVFPTEAQALGDYLVQVDPKSLACEGEYLRSSFGTEVKLVSARALPDPRIGDRSAARRWVLRLGAVTMNVDLIAFVRGRTNSGLFVLAPGSPQPALDALARLVAERVKTTP